MDFQNHKHDLVEKHEADKMHEHTQHDWSGTLAVPVTVFVTLDGELITDSADLVCLAIGYVHDVMPASVRFEIDEDRIQAMKRR